MARSVYPIPIWSILRSLKCATPSTAFTVSVPDSLALPSRLASCPIAMVIGPANPVTGFPWASSAVTSIAGVIVTSGRVLVGCTVKRTCVAGGGGGGGGAVMSNALLFALVRPELVAWSV